MLSSPGRGSVEEAASPAKLFAGSPPRERRLPVVLYAIAGHVRSWRRFANPSWAMPLRVSVTIGLLGLVFVRNNLSNLPNEIGQTNVPLLAAMLGCSYVAWIVNTYRWQRILAGFRLSYGFGELFRQNLAGVFYGLALPGQVSGEVLKAVRLARRTKQRHAIYVSIFLDRVYGLMGIALLGCIALVLDPPEANWLGWTPSLSVLAAVTLAAIAVVALPWLSTLARPALPGGHPAVRKFGSMLLGLTTADGFAPTATTFAVGCTLGLVSQALLAAIHWGVALGIGLSVSPLALTWILALGAIVWMLPISIAGLGVRETTYVSLLSLFGVSAGPALMLSLAMFTITLALGLTGGLLDLVAARRMISVGKP